MILKLFNFLSILQVSSSFILPTPSNIYTRNDVHRSTIDDRKCSIITNSNSISNRNMPLFAGGFGGGGGKNKQKGNKGKKGSTMSAKKRVQLKENLVKAYGGDIAKGTQERMQIAMTSLPQHIQEVAELYRKVKRWDASMAALSPEQLSKVPSRDVDGATRATSELEMLYDKYDISDEYMHNVFQQVTWDASADAKAVRASIGKMPDHILKRVDKACDIIAESVKRAGRKEGRCLDVGCGHGTLIPNLTNAGIYANQITGIDLSPEMIRNAEERYRGPQFIAADYFQFKPNDNYDGIMFCSALHDLPDMESSLSKAADMLRPEGKIVIMHAQGGAHVLGQVKANPVLVSRGLPSTEELTTWAQKMDLVVEVAPSDAGSPEDDENGYLAVLRKEG